MADIELEVDVKPNRASVDATANYINKTLQDITLNIGSKMDSAQAAAMKRQAGAEKAMAGSSGSLSGKTMKSMFPYSSALAPQYQKRFETLMNNAPGWDAFRRKVPDPTMNPTPVNVGGGNVYRANLIASAAKAEAAKMGWDKNAQNNMATAAILKERFKYTDDGKLNKFANEDASAYARLYGFSGAASIISGDNVQGKDILDKVIYAASQRSRVDDLTMGKNGSPVWKDPGSILQSAVDKGEGKWEDPNADKTAKNFKIIDKELKNIDKETGNVGEGVDTWSDNLDHAISSASMLLGIFYLLKKAGKFAIEFGKASIEGAANAQKTLQGDYTLAGMSASDIMYNQVAARKAGLGETAVNDAVVAFAKKKGQFATEGKGLDLFGASVMKTIEGFLNASDPNEGYWGVLQTLLEQLNATNDQERRNQILAYAQDLIGSAGTGVLGNAYRTRTTNINEYRSVTGVNAELPSDFNSILNKLAEQNKDFIDLQTTMQNDINYWKSELNKILIPLGTWLSELLHKATTTQKKWSAKITEGMTEGSINFIKLASSINDINELNTFIKGKAPAARMTPGYKYVKEANAIYNTYGLKSLEFYGELEKLEKAYRGQETNLDRSILYTTDTSGKRNFSSLNNAVVAGQRLDDATTILRELGYLDKNNEREKQTGPDYEASRTAWVNDLYTAFTKNGSGISIVTDDYNKREKFEDKFSEQQIGDWGLQNYVSVFKKKFNPIIQAYEGSLKDNVVTSDEMAAKALIIDYIRNIIEKEQAYLNNPNNAQGRANYQRELDEMVSDEAINKLAKLIGFKDLNQLRQELGINLMISIVGDEAVVTQYNTTSAGTGGESVQY